MSKKGYLYDGETKEYMGDRELSIDPMESKLQGKEVYLIPANATVVKPNLSYKKGKAIVWNGLSPSSEKLDEENGLNNDGQSKAPLSPSTRRWVYIDDNRGTEVWRKSDDEKVTVDWLGEIGDEYTTEEPAKPEPVAPSLEELQAQANRLQQQIQEAVNNQEEISVEDRNVKNSDGKVKKGEEKND